MKTCWRCGASATCEYGVESAELAACDAHDPTKQPGLPPMVPIGFFYQAFPAGRGMSLADALRASLMPAEAPAAPPPGATCATCGATWELERTVYDQWQCVDLSECAKRQLAARRGP